MNLFIWEEVYCFPRFNSGNICWGGYCRIFISGACRLTPLKGPVYPETPASLKYERPYPDYQTGTPSAEYIKSQEAFDIKSKAFQTASDNYNRYVSMIALGFAILMLVVSLVFFKKIPVIADGVLLGGVLTLAYSIVRGFNTNDDVYRFLVVGAGLVTAMVLGYLKFVAPQQNKK